MSSSEEYAHDIHPKALRILRALDHFAGKASTSQLTDETGYRNNVLNYWFNELIEDGAIEKVDEKDESTPIPANVYRITDFGESIVEVASGTQLTIEDRVESLEEDVEMLQDSHKELRNVVKQLVEQQ